MHLFRRHPVNLTLYGRDRGERGVGALAPPIAHSALRHHLADGAQVTAVGLRRNLEIHFLATDVAANDVANQHGHAVQSELLRERAQPVGIEADGQERPERHVTGDAAERVQNGDAHQTRYDAPLPVLNTRTSAVAGTRLAAMRSAST